MLRIKGRLLALLSFVMVLMFAGSTWAADVLPDVIVFYRESCNDCRQMDQVLDDLLEIYPGVVVAHIEEQAEGAADLMWSLSSKYGIFPSKFPVIFVGDQGIVGSGRDKELLLRTTVRNCVFNDCPSPIELVNEKPFPFIMLATALVAILVIAIMLL